MLLSSTRPSRILEGTVGHRGSTTKAPENTMSSFRQAYRDGADSIELDVLKTSDGHFLVMHDDTVDRTTDGSGPVSNFTLAEAQKLDAGSWFGPQFKGERPPELGEVLDWAKDKIHVLIEVKKTAAKDSSGKELVDLIREKGVSDQITVMSFDHAFVDRIEKQAPELDTGVLCPPHTALKAAGAGAATGLVTGLTAGWLSTGNPLVGVAAAAGGLLAGGLLGRRLGMSTAYRQATSGSADHLMPHWSISTSSLVRQAHRHGKGVVPYTVDKPLVAAEQKFIGVNGLITNRPHQIQAG